MPAMPTPPPTSPAPPGTGRIVDVAIGILVREGPAATAVLIARRPSGTVYADYWEFPGGKVHPGETPAAALIREFEEELGLQVVPGQVLPIIEHVYPHGHVRLHPFYCTCLPDAVPQNRHVAEHRWVAPATLGDYRFPEANVSLIELVTKAQAARK